MFKIKATLIIILFLFNSCASLNERNIASTYVEAFNSIKGAVFGFEDAVITKNLVKNIPYASAKLKIGNGPAGLVILESKQKNNEVWVSADNVLIVMNEGRIIRTLGLINNLTSFEGPNQSFRDLLEGENPILEYYSYYSYDKPLLNGMKVEVTIEIKGIEEVDILGESKLLLLVEEVLKNNRINWKKTNRYWLDPKTFFVWKSIQHISPKLPEFDFEVTKKPA